MGPAENAVSCIPAIETAANVRAAEMATRELNAGYLTVMLEGKYTDAYLAQAGKDAPKFTDEDLRIISSPIDFVGVNVYTPDHYVVAADNERGFALAPFPVSFPHMNSTTSFDFTSLSMNCSMLILLPFGARSPLQLGVTDQFIPSNPILLIYVAQTVVHPK